MTAVGREFDKARRILDAAHRSHGDFPTIREEAIGILPAMQQMQAAILVSGGITEREARLAAKEIWGGSAGLALLEILTRLDAASKGRHPVLDDGGAKC